jgi:5-formyltetrahydrofolate cyclo-ligase
VSGGSVKAALRRALLERRAAIDSDLRWRWSAQISAAITASELWKSARTVAAFVGARGEPDTRPILKKTLAARKGLYLPRVVSDTEIDFARVADLSTLVEGKFKLTEPSPVVTSVPLDLAEPELILVPGLAFGSDGSRIGYGRGYYDRVLGKPGGSGASMVGVCFASFLDPVEGAIPTQAHDVRMTHVVTDAGIVVCRVEP